MYLHKNERQRMCCALFPHLDIYTFASRFYGVSIIKSKVMPTMWDKHATLSHGNYTSVVRAISDEDKLMMFKSPGFDDSGRLNTPILFLYPPCKRQCNDIYHLKLPGTWNHCMFINIIIKHFLFYICLSWPYTLVSPSVSLSSGYFLFGWTDSKLLWQKLNGLSKLNYDVKTNVEICTPLFLSSTRWWG